MENPFLRYSPRILVSLAPTSLGIPHLSGTAAREYGVAQRLYQLSPLTCVRLHTIVNVTFPDTSKAMWLGEQYIHDGIKGNSLELQRPNESP